MDDLEGSHLSRALSQLGTSAFAVRSSAIQEDNDHDSFAGILISQLNIKTMAGVLSAIQDIRRSTLAPAAAGYSLRRNVASLVRIAAIVQSFVPAEASGVLFMRDPLSGADQVVVEASWGLGPGTVEGLVRPDRWVISSDTRVISAHIADKDVAVVPSENGGTTQVPVDAARRRRPCLSSESLDQLLRLAVECERLFGGPQDIEWATSEDRVWLLQSRPITALGW
jgi:pyruvate,water dikinase